MAGQSACVYVFDPTSLAIVEANPAAVAFYGADWGVIPRQLADDLALEVHVTGTRENSDSFGQLIGSRQAGVGVPSGLPIASMR